jgi:hypothetical protein
MTASLCVTVRGTQTHKNKAKFCVMQGRHLPAKGKRTINVQVFAMLTILLDQHHTTVSRHGRALFWGREQMNEYCKTCQKSVCTFETFSAKSGVHRELQGGACMNGRGMIWPPGEVAVHTWLLSEKKNGSTHIVPS